MNELCLHLGDLARLVIATENGDSLGVAHLQGNEQSDSLNRVIAAIDVVTHEKVVCARWLASNFEKLPQIVELAVDITANGHRRFNNGNIGLLNQNLFGL